MDGHLNNKVLAIRQWLLDHPFQGMGDLVVAYNSLTVHYSPVAIRNVPGQLSTAAAFVKYHLRQAFHEAVTFTGHNHNTTHIPVCYADSYAPDMQFLCSKNGRSAEDIISLHSAPEYRVYMIGFLPGFPYLGKLDSNLIQLRKERPVTVKGGSVGIAGWQTGIYPFDSPGGWHIIGRTPMKMFDAALAQPCRLNPGDRIKFYSIGLEEFESLSRNPLSAGEPGTK